MREKALTHVETKEEIERLHLGITADNSGSDVRMYSLLEQTSHDLKGDA